MAQAGAQGSPEVSPDGRWLAYHSNESGSWQVYVRPYPDFGSGKWQVARAGGREPVWSSDGRELHFRRGRELRSVPVESGTTFRIGAEPVVLEIDIAELGKPRYAVHPDGRLLVLTEKDDAGREPAQIVMVEGFGREVERLLAER